MTIYRSLNDQRNIANVMCIEASWELPSQLPKLWTVAALGGALVDAPAGRLIFTWSTAMPTGQDSSQSSQAFVYPNSDECTQAA